jgi:HEAT repeat protein
MQRITCGVVVVAGFAGGLLLWASRNEEPTGETDQSTTKHLAPAQRADSASLEGRPSQKTDNATYQGKSVREWLHQFEAKDPRFRLEAAKALGNIGPEAEPAIPALMEALGDGNQDVAQAAAAVLGMIGKAAIPHLATTLHDEDDQVSRLSGVALAGMGPVGIPELSKALREQDQQIRIVAASVLLLVRPDGMKALGKALEEGDRELRRLVVVCLLQNTDQSGIEWVVPGLVQALEDDSVSTMAERALGRIGAPAVPVLVEALEGGGARAVLVCPVLVMIGKPAVAPLIECLKNKDQFLLAALTLKKIDQTIAVRALCQSFQSHDRVIRMLSASVLGGLGENARIAIPALQEAAKDEDIQIRTFAQEALKAIENQSQQPHVQSTGLPGAPVAKPTDTRRIGYLASVNDVIRDYEADIVTADKTYKGKEVYILGCFRNVGITEQGYPYVLLFRGPKWQDTTVKCVFSKTYSKWSDLSPLDTNTIIIVKGAIQGKSSAEIEVEATGFFIRDEFKKILASEVRFVDLKSASSK